MAFVEESRSPTLELVGDQGPPVLQRHQLEESQGKEADSTLAPKRQSESLQSQIHFVVGSGGSEVLGLGNEKQLLLRKSSRNQAWQS